MAVGRHRRCAGEPVTIGFVIWIIVMAIVLGYPGWYEDGGTKKK
jgi:hypothetical protein